MRHKPGWAPERAASIRRDRRRTPGEATCLSAAPKRSRTSIHSRRVAGGVAVARPRSAGRSAKGSRARARRETARSTRANAGAQVRDDVVRGRGVSIVEGAQRPEDDPIEVELRCGLHDAFIKRADRRSHHCRRLSADSLRDRGARALKLVANVSIGSSRERSMTRGQMCVRGTSASRLLLRQW